ncbi:hypothetical protein EJB05_55216, partial [Eragrostis curvula]
MMTGWVWTLEYFRSRKVNESAIAAEIQRDSIDIQQIENLEFEEIVLSDKLMGQNEVVNVANIALVKHFNSIKDSRLNIYQAVLAKRKLSKDKFMTLIKGYVRLLNRAQELMETVENLNGSPAVMPTHFRDVNFKI